MTWKEVNTGRAARHKLRVKLLVFKKLGSKCACCGELHPYFLTLDHIHNDGYKHRASFKGRGSVSVVQVYADVLKDPLAHEKYQLLCMSCNSAKAKFGVCPHISGITVEQAYEKYAKVSKDRRRIPDNVVKDSRGRFRSVAFSEDTGFLFRVGRPTSWIEKRFVTVQ